MSQNFLPWLNWILHHPDLDVKLSCDHVEYFRIGHFKAKLVACDDLILSYFLLTFCWWVLLQAPTTRLAAPLHQNKQQMSKKEDQIFKLNVLQTLTLNVQFWSAHHVHGTKLHPKRGCRELNSTEEKSFETSSLHPLFCGGNGFRFPQNIKY